MTMEIDATEVETRVMETVKYCQQRQEAPLVWAMEVGKCLRSLGVGVPSPELGDAVVPHLCFHNNHPSLWKFLQQALSSRLLSRLHVLPLLSSRVIPHRRSQPEAYRLFLELFSRYGLSLDLVAEEACKEKIIKSVDAALQLSQRYGGVRVVELGHLFILSFFSIFVGLIDSIFEDIGLEMKSGDVVDGPFGTVDDMDVDMRGNYNVVRNEHREMLRKTNSVMALEVLAKLTESRKAMVLLRLVHLNMSENFNGLLQRLRYYEANKLASPCIKSAEKLLEKVSANIYRAHHFEYQLNKRQLIWRLVDARPCQHMSYCNSGSGQSACWVPFDIYLENVMDGKQLLIRSAIAVLTEIIRSLRVLNQASWQETFLALWLSALRLVQRVEISPCHLFLRGHLFLHELICLPFHVVLQERDPVEGPIPHLESRLCILLTIVPLAIANVLEDDAKSFSSSLPGGALSGSMEAGNGHGVEKKGQTSRRLGLISSLQVLGQFSALLCPPASVISAANIAATKAAGFISNSKNVNHGLGCGSHNDTYSNAGGNMRHLIVEACIARNLIDTSVYFWPNYVSSSVVSLLDNPSIQKSPWLTFMEGAPLSGSLVNLLLVTPASSLAELEKLYHIALNGSVEEKSAAAKILCGATLSCGWNIQEHVVAYVVKLLSPPKPSAHSGERSHLIDYLPMLSALLFGASTIDNVHVLSLHGVIPEVAAALMPLCEVYGSVMPTSNSKSSTEEPSVYSVFSCAFLFLLRLWKFYRPPMDQCLSGGAGLGGELTLEYLLSLRNSRIASHSSVVPDDINGDPVPQEFASDKPMYLDFFPKLRAWYCQNKSCVASPLHGLSTGNPVHQNANKILNMIFWKITKSTSSSATSTTLSSNSLSGSPSGTGEDLYQRPMLPAWDVLEAIPYIVDAILTACAHGRLSSRDLTTGLRDLIDFLPASLGTIVSYFSAEVTRGIWKPVPMNGTDWPSPAATLPSVQFEMKELLAAAGVDFPSCPYGLPVLMLPLPVAALVSLTITFKLTKGVEYIHAVVGPALENCASGCLWSSIPIIGSLWAQKVRRWHHFIVVTCARSVFKQSKEAVAQLLRSCFSSFLGSLNASTSLLTNQRSISGLLGSIIAVPGVPFLAPGFLYLRSCRTIHNIQHVNDVIVGLVAEHARESATRWASTDSSRLKSVQTSLSLAAAKAREVAMLGASLLCVTGGMNLVQVLYRETIPTWLLSSRDEKLGEVSAVSRIMEGYSMAYLLILSGSFIWGIGDQSPSWALSRRARTVGGHMDFLARVLEGNVSLGCHPATWKAYVSCLVGLVAGFAPAWVQDVKLDTLRELTRGLRGWHESELALSLLERGGVEAINSVVELANAIS
ncbi:hypothetical protein Tsubulata_000069 [Turnera subulata]|uniref:Mediator of RNA polymerase II transcription subunit 33A n=1 Tax=Turnera subulata TaxID=218843 RepID=A0A9Q0J8N8_9ROSI|nr:hypothetical protein Tsubulata_000069 [Turnera subulata]